VIYIFEQDVLGYDMSEAKLTEQYVHNHLAYQVDEDNQLDVVVESDQDDELIIIQAFNSEGESWKFIQKR
jgi:hypothetical protein